MVTEFDDLSEYEQIHLRMEDVIEERIQIDKDACGRVYEAHYLVTVDYGAAAHEFPPEKGDCIPCWRKKHDLPKIDRSAEN